jgi:hypothetical protein
MTADPQLWSSHDVWPRLFDGARFRLFALSAPARLFAEKSPSGANLQHTRGGK